MCPPCRIDRTSMPYSEQRCLTAFQPTWMLCNNVHIPNMLNKPTATIVWTPGWTSSHIYTTLRVRWELRGERCYLLWQAQLIFNQYWLRIWLDWSCHGRVHTTLIETPQQGSSWFYNGYDWVRLLHDVQFIRELTRLLTNNQSRCLLHVLFCKEMCLISLIELFFIKLIKIVSLNQCKSYIYHPCLLVGCYMRVFN